MKNREVFAKDPIKNELVNNGVAEVVDASDEAQLRTLRYELETFVCNGEYAKGLDRILTGYVSNMGKPEQPGIWVSGFYGSGKSHLVKMLRHFWVNTRFSDGSEARGLASLPHNIREALTELSTVGKRHGGLHAAAGTLGAGASESVRLALLAIVFNSVGLPQDYASARCEMWLKREKIFGAVRQHIEQKGKDFRHELLHLYVSPTLHEAIRTALPDFASSNAEVRVALREQFPERRDISNQQMEEAIRDALAVDGELPCTLIVLDEVQQYIDGAPDRPHNIQQVAEACCKHFGDKLLLVGTGQNSITGLPQLQKIKDRFPIPIELSDTDVETVIREIVLRKRADCLDEVADELKKHSGEISRHLQGTDLESCSDDNKVLVPDYPLLPTRRRFWERTLRAVDPAGTSGQLRTQLKIVHEAVRTTADMPLGSVVPGDFVYEQVSTDLVQTGVLLRETDNLIRGLKDGSPENEMKSRLCALCFLIGKLPREAGADAGVRATPDTLADLIVSDLKAGSGDLRKQIPTLLSQLADDGHLMLVEGEYRLQTRESAAWDQDFKNRQTRLVNNDGDLASNRADMLRAAIGEALKPVRLLQGQGKVPRKHELSFSAECPTPDQAVPVWIQDGWNVEESGVLAECRQAGTESPVVYAFVPRRNAEEFKKAIAASKAAEDTLNSRGLPTSPEGIEARRAMETRLTEAKRKCKTTLADILSGARVFLAGGSEKTGNSFAEAVQEAADDALLRMFPEFDVADQPNTAWDNVIKRVRNGDGSALETIGYKGDPEKHPVCSAVFTFVGPGRKGKEIRTNFERSPYGWSREAVNAALLVLTLSGHISAKQNGGLLQVKDLDQTKIGVAEFRVEVATVTTAQKIALRKLFQTAGVKCSSGEEQIAAGRLLDQLLSRASDAGGEPPAPARPNTVHLQDLQNLVGNEQLVALHNERERLASEATEWLEIQTAIHDRLPRWKTLGQLLKHADGLPEAEEVRPQYQAILDNRQLLNNPNPVPPLCDTLAKALRTSLGKSVDLYTDTIQTEMEALSSSDVWQSATAEQQRNVVASHNLDDEPNLRLGTEAELLETLDRASLETWKTRIDAVPQRFSQAKLELARLLEPRASKVTLPGATIKTEPELDEYLARCRKVIVEKLGDGPVII
ncbi:MAG: BREX system P-loop protein BrxC [Thermoguttaceae bacterium]